jgi:hypothetical protein
MIYPDEAMSISLARIIDHHVYCSGTEDSDERNIEE